MQTTEDVCYLLMNLDSVYDPRMVANESGEEKVNNIPSAFLALEKFSRGFSYGVG